MKKRAEKIKIRIHIQFFIVITLYFSACTASEQLTLNLENNAFTFAVIGDFGNFKYHTNVESVANLVESWKPDFIATVGDNNYKKGSTSTIDKNIGQYYGNYIYPYTGGYGLGSPDKINRFFPALGNHDLITKDGEPYLEYFTLPNNERYYEKIIGPIQLIILNSDNDPDGQYSNDIQGQWTKQVLNQSTALWKIVLFHHPPYSSGYHGSYPFMRWPFQEWGATAVISGHDHNYERLDMAGIPYFVNGAGGAKLRKFGKPIDESIVRYNDKHGALRVSGSAEFIKFEFINTDEAVIDEYTILNSTFKLTE